MVSKTFIIKITLSSIAAILLVILVFNQSSLFKNNPSNASLEQQDISNATSGNTQLQQYKINTECDLLYSLSTGKYPDGDNITPLKISNLVEKYPIEFAPWKTVLENNDTRAQFVRQQPLSDQFRDVFTTAVMKEDSINPKLHPIALLITDPASQIMFQQYSKQYNCSSYFNQKLNQ